MSLSCPPNVRITTVPRRDRKVKHILAISLHNRAYGSTDLRIAEISLETATEQDFEAAKEDDDLF